MPEITVRLHHLGRGFEEFLLFTVPPVFFFCGEDYHIVSFWLMFFEQGWNSKGQKDMTCLCGSFLLFNSIGIWLNNLSCLYGSFFITDVQLNNVTECCNEKIFRTDERTEHSENQQDLGGRKGLSMRSLINTQIVQLLILLCVSVFYCCVFSINHPKNKMTTKNTASLTT